MGASVEFHHSNSLRTCLKMMLSSRESDECENCLQLRMHEIMAVKMHYSVVWHQETFSVINSSESEEKIKIIQFVYFSNAEICFELRWLGCRLIFRERVS